MRRLDLLSTAGATITLGSGEGTSSVVVRGDAVDTDLTSHAPLKRLQVHRWLGTSPRGLIATPSVGRATTEVFRGQLDVGDVGTLDLGGVENSSISITGSIGQLRGVSATDSTFDVGGDIGLVSFAHLGGSRIFAGVRALPAESAVPTAVADFFAPSTIRQVRLDQTDASGSAAVAARFIGNVRLGFVDLAPVRGDVIFAADRIRGVVARAYLALGGTLTTVRVPPLDTEVRDVGSVELRAL